MYWKKTKQKRTHPFDGRREGKKKSPQVLKLLKKENDLFKAHKL
jgi:hypothetical protein